LRGRNARTFGWFISTLGFAAIAEAIVQVAFGSHAIVSIPGPFSLHGVHIGSVIIPYQQLFIFITFVAVIILLEVFYGRTWLGKAMRGTAEDRDAAALVGVNPSVMGQASFIMAGLIAGIAGFVIAPVTFSDPSVGLSFTIKGFVALAIGGFGSIRGAIVGGLILGLGEQYFDLYVSSNYEVLAGAMVIVVILLLRPQGLFRTTVARTV
jgi:branched-subunit amino acid ABC-type transport system permease component